jgi:hypothetical protein
MLCERESAKAFWKISFQTLKIPLKEKMGIFGWSLEKAPLAPNFKFKSLRRN